MPGTTAVVFGYGRVVSWSRIFGGVAAACAGVAVLLGAAGRAETGSWLQDPSPTASTGAPEACFQVVARKGLRLSLDAGCSRDPHGEALAYGWDLGDGETASGPLVDHTYGACPRTSSLVALTVTDASGASDAHSRVFDLADLDRDGDRLHACRERGQATSDRRIDTDRDGLDDLVESRWWGRRERVFCGLACSFPNPARRDIYVEVDHMHRLPGPIVDGLRDTFAAHDIDLHVDQGRLGGGGHLRFRASTSFDTSATDDVDRYYNKRFARVRRGVFHYMLIVHSLAGDPGCSIGGLGEVPDRDGRRFGDLVVIFGGCLADRGSGAWIHVFLQELGHNLFGRIDPIEDAYPCSSTGRDRYHDRYHGYAMWPLLGGGGATYHPNRWEVDMRGMGRGIVDKLGSTKRVNKIFEFGYRPC